MTFKEFRKGVLGVTSETVKVKTTFSTNLFIILVWIFYAKWVYMFRSIKERKNNGSN